MTVAKTNKALVFQYQNFEPVVSRLSDTKSPALHYHEKSFKDMNNFRKMLNF